MSAISPTSSDSSQINQILRNNNENYQKKAMMTEWVLNTIPHQMRMLWPSILHPYYLPEDVARKCELQ
jgi:hypothetical protein